jgi:hypothetical protein
MANESLPFTSSCAAGGTLGAGPSTRRALRARSGTGNAVAELVEATNNSPLAARPGVYTKATKIWATAVS